MRSGGEEAKAEEKKPEKKYRKYDFTTPRKFTKDRIKMLVAHGDLPLRFPFAAHHPVHHPQCGLRRQVHHHRVLCLNVPSPLCPGVDGYIYHGQYVRGAQISRIRKNTADQVR